VQLSDIRAGAVERSERQAGSLEVAMPYSLKSSARNEVGRQRSMKLPHFHQWAPFLTRHKRSKMKMRPL
jgi:hypothetical protein